jgi:hemicentin
MATLLLVYAFLLHAFSGVFGGIFQISPNNVTGLNGASLTLSCHANSAPASVRWTFEDAFVETSSSVSTTYEAGDASIVFSPLSYLNEGVYRCIALNSSGNELFRSHPGRVNVFGQPSIVVPPTSVSVVAGSGAEFTCMVTSDPQGSVTWHFNHQQLQSSSKYTIQTNPHRLMIVNVQETDVGYYDCNATNVYGSTFVSARLSIVTAAGNRPVITLSPGDAISAEEGSSQSIGCFTTGEPTPAVYWTRNGMLLAETDQLSITRQAGNSTLSFRALSSSDSGSYQCYANNTHGSDIMTVLLSVLVAPMVTRAPNDVIVRAGETPTESVVCEATGNPPPLINILDPLGRIISTDGSWSPPSLTRSEGGTYMCAASNTVGRTTSSFTVAVQDVPLITRAPQNTVVSIGGEVILSCEAEGPPNPVTIAWMRADGSTLGTTGGELRLFDVSQNDAGVYVCKATNSIGSSTASANVTVLGESAHDGCTVELCL